MLEYSFLVEPLEELFELKLTLCLSRCVVELRNSHRPLMLRGDQPLSFGVDEEGFLNTGFPGEKGFVEDELKDVPPQDAVPLYDELNLLFSNLLLFQPVLILGLLLVGRGIFAREFAEPQKLGLDFSVLVTPFA